MARNPAARGLHAANSFCTRLHAGTRNLLISLCTGSLHGVLHSVHSVTRKLLILLCTRFARGARTGSPHTPPKRWGALGRCARATKWQKAARYRNNPLEPF